jgi:hypothetical protein
MSVSKRQKEKERQDRRREKEAKREERRKEKASRPALDGEDPDIAGIVPGPQPLPDELVDPEDDDTAAESR